MLLILLIYTLKNKFKGNQSFNIAYVLRRLVLKIKYIIPFFLISSTSFNNSVSEVEKISFSIIKNKSSIGFIDIEKASLDRTTIYTINSEVNAKVIFNFKAVGREKSIYKEDTLIFSSIYRKLNSRVKLNQSLSFVKGKYLLKDKHKRVALNVDIIRHNLVTLFFFEPKGIQKIYSDKFKKMVNITAIRKGKYKIVLPNKSTSIYHYKNGKCTMIEVVGSFYKVSLIQN